MFVSLGCVTAHLNFYFVFGDNAAFFAGDGWFARVNGGESSIAPYAYRVLIPTVSHLLDAGFGLFGSSELAAATTMWLLEAVLSTSFLIVTFRFLLKLFAIERALLGTLALAGLAPVPMLMHQWTALDSWLLDVAFTLGLSWILEGRHRSLLVLTAIATLNNEKAILIPLAYLIVAADPLKAIRTRTLPPPGAIVRVASCFAVYLTVSFAIHLAVGDARRLFTIPAIWNYNTGNGTVLRTALWQIAMCFGVFWVFAAAGVAHAPPVLRKLLWVFVIYLPLFAVYGVWEEVRLLTPFYPILMGLALSFISSQLDHDGDR